MPGRRAGGSVETRASRSKPPPLEGLLPFSPLFWFCPNESPPGGSHSEEQGGRSEPVGEWEGGRAQSWVRAGLAAPRLHGGRCSGCVWSHDQPWVWGVGQRHPVYRGEPGARCGEELGLVPGASAQSLALDRCPIGRARVHACGPLSVSQNLHMCGASGVCVSVCRHC